MIKIRDIDCCDKAAYSWSVEDDEDICVTCGTHRQETYGLLTKIQYFYWDLIPYEYRPGELWYKFTCWLWKRYRTNKKSFGCIALSLDLSV